ncbi:LacI family transcriptional regulator [Opitutaceae bacterium TAV4]|nr:LacI family transcriptional regulator [Opitutaceae bacterium TAV4]RRK01014.1 LacI family transcriptional regulator [Opitutaceae bacterium TAV3]
MAAVATAAGVSKNAVSLALRGDPQIPAATRRRIENVATQLGYARNPVLAELMSELRKERAPAFRRTLALINANEDARAFERHPTIPVYVAGCRERSSFLGYKFDEFWLHDPELNGERLHRIFQARGIRGAVVTGLMHGNVLPERFAGLWARYPCVVTGVRTRGPTLSFCCVDHHALVVEAMEQVLRLGYRRPALVVDGHIDRMVERRFSAGMWVGQQALPAARRVEGFYEVQATRSERSLFVNWFRRARPDAILTLNRRVREWLTDLGVSAPGDIGLVQLERRRGTLDWAGMDQHNDLTGAAAVDMLVGMMHGRESGVPAFPRATLISASWREGETARADAR